MAEVHQQDVSHFQFGRIGRAEIWKDGKRLDDFKTEGLDFRFRTMEIYQGGVTTFGADVSILGLSVAHANLLCRYTDEASMKNLRYTVCVYAGYETDGGVLQPLFNMPITRAEPTPLPDMWVNITAKMQDRSEKSKSYDIEARERERQITRNSPHGGAFRAYDLIQDMGRVFGLKFRWHGEAQARAQRILLRKFAFTGSSTEAVARLGSRFAKSSSGEGLVFFGSKEVYSDGRPIFYDIFTSGFKGMWAEHYITVDKEHGMIGLPAWTTTPEQNTRVRVKTLLNPSAKPGDMVKLTSEVAAALSGNYRVLSVNHAGHLRGSTWETTMDCFRLYDGKDKAEQQGATDSGYSYKGLSILTR